MRTCRFVYLFGGRFMVKSDYIKVNDWNSEYISVNKLLRYLQYGKSGSEASKETYCLTLNLFCRMIDKNPDDLIKIEDKALEGEIERFLDGYSCRRTANNRKTALKAFFVQNGKRDLEYPHYYQPSRGGGTRPMYVPTLEEARRMADCAGSLKARAINMVLSTAGIRNSTCRALKYGVVSTNDLTLQDYTIKNEIRKGEKNLAIIVFPEMKKYVPYACKGRIPYLVFTSAETTEALKNYLTERERKNGKIADEEFLFPSDNRGFSRDVRVNKPMCLSGLNKVIKTAARRAGLKNWKHVTAHSLRKTTNQILIDQPEDSRLHEEDKEFFMGHILGGSRDAYYDKTRVEKMREKFSKLQFNPDAPHSGEQFTRKFAKLYGIDYGTVVQEAEKRSGKEPTEAEIMTVLKELIENGKKKERHIIDESELSKHLDDGWTPEHVLQSGKIVICKNVM